MEIPLCPRYNLACQIAHEFIIEEDIKTYPVDPFILIKKNKWELIKYSDLAKKCKKNVSDISETFRTPHSYLKRINNIYTIYYNDTLNNRTRIRFNLMHEIGHIILDHLVNFNRTSLFKKSMSASEYATLENEANCFARNVLAPAPLVNTMGLNKYNPIALMDTFDISFNASTTRISLFKTDLNCLYKNQIEFLNTNYDVSKSCRYCNTKYIYRNAEYCPICGKNKLSKGNNFMRYDDGIDLNDEARAITCPACNNDDVDGEYCKICGTHIINRCSNNFSGCEKLADGNARYCIECGTKTTFFANGILKPWNEYNHDKYASGEAAVTDDSDDLPF